MNNNIDFLRKEINKNKVFIKKINHKDNKSYMHDLHCLNNNNGGDIYSLALNASKQLFKYSLTKMLLEWELNGETHKITNFFNHLLPSSLIFKIDHLNEQISYIFYLVKHLNFNKNFSLFHALSISVENFAFKNVKTIINNVEALSLIKETAHEKHNNCIPFYLNKKCKVEIYDQVCEKMKQFILHDCIDLKKMYGDLLLYSTSKYGNWFLNQRNITPEHLNDIQNKHDFLSNLIGIENVKELSLNNIILKEDIKKFIINTKEGYMVHPINNQILYGEIVQSFLVKDQLCSCLHETKCKKLKL